MALSMPFMPVRFMLLIVAALFFTRALADAADDIAKKASTRFQLMADDCATKNRNNWESESLGHHLLGVAVKCGTCKTNYFNAVDGASDNLDYSAAGTCTACSTLNRAGNTASTCGECYKGTTAPDGSTTSANTQCSCPAGQKFNVEACEADCPYFNRKAAETKGESTALHHLLAVDTTSCAACLDGYYTSGTDGATGGAVAAVTKCDKTCASLNRASGTNGVCGACNTGYNGDATGNVACTINACKPGEYLATDKCLPCAVNSFSAGGSVTACTACTVGSNTNQLTGQASCAFCNAGYTPINNVCTACAVNTYKPLVGNDACLPCPATTMTTNGATAQLACMCSAGYEPAATANTCTACIMQYYKPLPGADKCLPCEPTTQYTLQTASLSCQTCAGLKLYPAITGTQSVDVRVSNEVVIRVEKCLYVANTNQPVYKWVLTSQTPSTPALDTKILDSATTPTLLLPQNTLTADTTYVFTVSVFVAGVKVHETTATVYGQPVDVTARLAPLGTSNSVAVPLVLDASASEGALPTQPLSFTFSCNQGTADGASCGLSLPTASATAKVEIAANSLTAGTYVFSVKVTRGAASNSATATTTLVSTGPTLSLLLKSDGAQTTGADGQQVTVNTDSTLTIVLTAVSQTTATGDFSYTCTSTPSLAIDAAGLSTITTSNKQVNVVLNAQQQQAFARSANGYAISCTVTQNGVTSAAKTLSVVVRPAPAATFTISPATGTVTSLQQVQLTVAGSDVTTVQFFLISPTTGREEMLSPVTNTLSLPAYLHQGTKQLRAYVRNKAGSLAVLDLNMQLTVTAPAGTFNEVVDQISNTLATEKDAYIKAQSVLLMSSQASASTNVEQQQQATTLAVNNLPSLAASLRTEDAVNVLYQVALAPGLTPASLLTVLDVANSLLATLKRTDVSSLTSSTSQTAATLTQLISFFTKQQATQSVPRARFTALAARSMALAGFNLTTLNPTVAALVSAQETIAAAASGAAAPEGGSYPVTTPGDAETIGTLTHLNNPTTTNGRVTIALPGAGGVSAGVNLPLTGSVITGVAVPTFLVSLILVNPNPYTGLVNNTLLSPILVPELTTVAGPRLGDLPSGSLIRLPRTSTVAAGQMVVCGFLPLPSGSAFEYYALINSTETGDVYLCPPKTSGGLGVYSLISVAAPVVAPAPTTPATGVPTNWENDTIRIGLGLGLGIGIPVVVAIVLVIYCLCVRGAPVYTKQVVYYGHPGMVTQPPPTTVVYGQQAYTLPSAMI